MRRHTINEFKNEIIVSRMRINPSGNETETMAADIHLSHLCLCQLIDHTLMLLLDGRQVVGWLEVRATGGGRAGWDVTALIRWNAAGDLCRFISGLLRFSLALLATYAGAKARQEDAAKTTQTDRPTMECAASKHIRVLVATMRKPPSLQTCIYVHRRTRYTFLNWYLV